MTWKPMVAAGSLISLLCLTACGTTVPQTSQISSGTSGSTASGLADPGGAAPATAGTTGPDGAGAPAAVGSADGNAVAGSSTAATTTAGSGSTSAAGQAPGSTNGSAQLSQPVGAGTPTGASAPRSGTSGRATGAPKASGRASAKPTANASAKPGATTAPAKLTPITVGIPYVDAGAALSSAGLATGTTITSASALKAIVQALNAAGGLNGRMINPVYDVVQGTDTDYSSDAQAACQKFTQDNHVDVVIDDAFGPNYGFAACMQKANIAVISAGAGADEQTLSGFKTEFFPFGLSFERAYSGVINGLVSTGYLAKKNKIGILYDTCATTATALNGAVKPLLSKLGFPAPDTATFDCAAGYGSLGSDSSQISAAVLKFSTDGVDRVLTMSSNEDLGLLIFAETAQSQGYFPGYMLSSYGDTAVARQDIPKGQWPGLHGAGNLAPLDVDANPHAPTAVESRCDALSSAGGAPAGTWTDDYYIWSVCSPILLLEAGLKADGSQANVAPLVAAIQGLGTSFAVPGIPDGASNFGTHPDGGSEVRAFAYNASCTCMQYTTGPMPV